MRNRYTKPPTFKRSFTISAVVHIGFILLMVLLPAGLFMSEKMPLMVTWVELPKGTGEDVYGIKTAKDLPQSTIQDQLEAPKPLDKEEDTKKIEVAKKPVVEEQKKEASPKAMPETKKDQKAVKGAGPTSTSRVNQALAKIDQKLKDRKVTPEAAQIESTGEGYKYGTSDKPNRDPVYQAELLKYRALVRARILGRWVPPQGVPDASSVKIIVFISKTGDVLSQRWATRSNNESVNQSAMRAVKSASPFPIPPEALKAEAYKDGFLVEFNPRKR